MRQSGKWCGRSEATSLAANLRRGAPSAARRTGRCGQSCDRERGTRPFPAAAPAWARRLPARLSTRPPAHSPRTAPPYTPPKKRRPPLKSDGSIPQTTKNGARTPRLHPPPARTPSTLLPAPAANPVTTARPFGKPRPPHPPKKGHEKKAPTAPFLPKRPAAPLRPKRPAATQKRA